MCNGYALWKHQSVSVDQHLFSGNSNSKYKSSQKSDYGDANEISSKKPKNCEKKTHILEHIKAQVMGISPCTWWNQNQSFQLMPSICKSKPQSELNEKGKTNQIS